MKGSYVVNTTADGVGLGACATGGSCTLRQAINQYNADTSGADTITFSVPTPATFNISANGRLNIDNTSNVPLTITGAGTTKTIIDGGSSVEVLNVPGNGVASLANLSIQHGSIAGFGGGILVDVGSTLNLSNVVVSHNATTNPGAGGGAGGGIFNGGGSITLTNSTVSSNTVGGSGGAGGGVYNYEGTLTLNNSTVSGNVVDGTVGGGGGGGIFNYFGPVVLSGSTVSGNTATVAGGILTWGGSFNSQNSTISSNLATTLGGGGLQVASGTVNLQGSTVSGNTAAGNNGGGIVSYGGNLTLSSSTVSGNSAANGGGIYNYSGAITANSSYVFFNTASIDGGGICGAGGTTSTTGTLVLFNTPDNFCVPPQPVGTTIFDDNFAGNTLSNAWTAVNGSNPSNGEQECYSSNNVTVNNGTLSEQAALGSQGGCNCPPSSSTPCPYVSGAVQWRSFSFTYGTISVRADLAGGIGTWPAIWLLGTNCQMPQWINPSPGSGCNWPSPGSNEIDIAEALPDTFWVNEQVHTTDSSGAIVQPGCYLLSCPVNTPGWHTYTLVWAPGSLIWEIDGVQTFNITTDVPSTPMFLIIDTAVGRSGSTVINQTLPQTTQVQYVKVTQP